MDKLYFVKSKNYELAERYEDKIRYYMDMLDDEYIFQGNISEVEYNKQYSELVKQSEELHNALNGCYSYGYKLKATWKNIEIINKYARMKELSLAIGEIQRNINEYEE